MKKVLNPRSKPYIGLAYMTGILTIKKYGTHSALNMFWEFSMTNPRELAPYVGFTEDEVRLLCQEYARDFDECKAWYDGYRFPHTEAVYNPRSVVAAMTSGIFDTYWNQTETFEALKKYIEMNYDGLREAVIALMAGEHRHITTANFMNDMTTFQSADDVLTLLVHLGYLGYDFEEKAVFVPNREILLEYASATGDDNWGEAHGLA
ncbi:MAG: AAA family ATPase [Schwartzia sp.]|nr:AAA family ATPase [Schwartzia sp. (in: firmicutes)]